MAVNVYRDQSHKGFIDLNKNELRNARVQNLGAAPGTPVTGQLYYDTVANKLYWWNNTSWIDATGAAGAILQSLIDAKGDLIVGTADNTPARKAVGSNGQWLQAQSGQADGLLWAAIADTDLPGTITRDTEVFLLTSYTTKGDLAVATGSGAVSRLGVGADGTFLVAASGQATGQQWRALATADLQEKIATADLTDWPRAAALDLNGQKLTGIADGTANTDGASYGQLLAVMEGKKWKDPVVAVALGNITLSGTQVIDGVSVVAGDRVLAAGQTSTPANGIYIVAAGAWARAADANIGSEITNATVISQGGTVSKGDVFTQSAAITTIGTDAQTWVKTGEGNQTYSADGSTITLTGSTFSVTTGGILNTHIGAGAAIAYSKLALTGAILNADLAGSIAYSKLVLTGAILNADLAGSIAYSKLVLGNSVVNADIAAGAAIAYSKLALSAALTAADVATAYVSNTRIARVYAAAITGGATTEVITHNLGTRDVQVALINNATPWDQVDVEWAATTINTITLTAPVNLPASYRCVVTG